MKVADSVVKKSANSKPSATDKENLVAAGRMLRSTKQTKKIKTENVVSEKTKPTPPNKSSKKITFQNKTTFQDKDTQTGGAKIKISVEDLTSTAGPSENYWEVLAERRQMALDDAFEKIRTLEEHIEKLSEQNERLTEQKLIHEEMLKETRALIEVLQEMIHGDSNGINNSLDDSVC
ncbi:uncharacterized protein LOC116847517 isoform X2 [Odontomachus brunneus]|uniref:uncharacterized protein LOC116847517 isoform X2 n=1 Tax=Odontomachus brunneus TaxID=486640 RepID=UPI0013F18E9C|nr:uncharacterized protein LOC116847517 isoform X2 [Odontomachus brunneus]